MKINIKPHEGINDVRFGHDSKTVRITLGTPESTREQSIFQSGEISIPLSKTDYYYNSSLQISYDENDTLEFIELSLKDSTLELSIYAFPLSKSSAEEVLSFLTKEKKVMYNKNGAELPYTYDFIAQDLSFWRQVIPEDDQDEDGKYFDSVGLGRTGYMQNK